MEEYLEEVNQREQREGNMVPAFEILQNQRGQMWGLFVPRTDQVIIPGCQPLPAAMFRPAPPKPVELPLPTYKSLPMARTCYEWCSRCNGPTQIEYIDTKDLGRIRAPVCLDCGLKMQRFSYRS